MPKKISQADKEAIIGEYLNGNTIEGLSKKFNCTKITIKRHLKNIIDNNKLQKTPKENKEVKEDHLKSNDRIELIDELENEELEERSNAVDVLSDPSFMEIAPIDFDIDNIPQKDLSSVPICDVDFPKVVYMIVDKKIELEIKYLKEYPEWGFLSQEELNRKTIEIFVDQKVAKRFCNKEQRVIKVPNTKVFKIAAPFLLKKGVSRIISVDRLIAL